MSKRTCSIADCDRPYRARGLCASHYNQEFAKDRHKKKLVECTVCGSRVLKGTGGGNNRRPVCSYECRTILIEQDGPRYCRLPDDHWARWFGKASEWPRYGWRDCAYCGISYTPISKNQKYCGDQCLKDSIRKLNGWVAREVTAGIPRNCTRCGEAYTSPYSGREHCSDYCKMLDMKDRGANPTSSWISRRQRVALYKRDNWTCWLCNEKVNVEADPIRDDDAPSLDHIIARSQGGSHDPSNLRTAHRGCNSLRSDSGAMSLREIASVACG